MRAVATQADTEHLTLRRGWLLLSLYSQFPRPILRHSLRSAEGVFSYTDDRSLELDVWYLSERGFLGIERMKAGEAEVVALNLRPDGVNIVEGTAEDPGVTLPT